MRLTTRISMFIAAAAAATYLTSARTAGADEGKVAEMLPAGAYGYAEFTGLGAVIEEVRESGLMKMIQKRDEYQEFMKSQQGKQFMAGKLMIEGLMGKDLWGVGSGLLGGEVAAALYPQAGSDQPAVLFLIRPADADVLEKPQQVMAAFMKKVDEVGDIQIYAPKEKGAQVQFATGPGWIGMASGEGVMDSFLALGEKTEGQKSIASEENFKKMAADMGAGHLGRVFVNTEMISEFTGGRMGIPEKLDEPMLSLLMGGLLELFVHSPYGGMTLDYEDGEIVLTAGVSGSPEKLEKKHQVHFAEVGMGTPRAPAVDGIVGCFTMHRDISAWYASREDLISEAALPGFDKFEAGLGNVLPGKDFGADILPMIGKNMQFVAAAQEFEHLKGVKPGVELPGFALIFDIKDEKAADIFQLTFQSIVAITNFQAAQNGRTPSVVEADIHNGVKFTSSRSLEIPEGDRLDISYNFVPAAARVGDRYILSSSAELCKALIDALKDPDASAPTGRDAELAVEMGSVVALLEANRKHLVADGIKKGKPAAQAKAEIAGLLELLGFFEEVRLDTARNEGGRDGYRVRLTAALK